MSLHRTLNLETLNPTATVTLAEVCGLLAEQAATITELRRRLRVTMAEATAQAYRDITNDAILRSQPDGAKMYAREIGGRS